MADNDGVLLMLPPGYPQLFERFDAAGQSINTFGVLLEDQQQSSLVLDGWVDSDHDGGVTYLSYYAGILASYDKNGSPRFVVETIEPHSLPKIFSNSEGSRWMDPEAQMRNMTVSVFGDEVHVFTWIAEGFKKIGAIDTYDLSNGTYRYSRRVPAPCSWLVFSGEHLYTAVDATVSKWSLSS